MFQCLCSETRLYSMIVIMAMNSLVVSVVVVLFPLLLLLLLLLALSVNGHVYWSSLL